MACAVAVAEAVVDTEDAVDRGREDDVQYSLKLGLQQPVRADVSDAVAAASTEPTDIQAWAVLILNTADPERKVALTRRGAALWQAGQLASPPPLSSQESDCRHAREPTPDRPARADGMTVVGPHEMKIGKGGTAASRIAILHSLANIEQFAIDLAWDIIARFGEAPLADGKVLPRGFFDDFVRVAVDEAHHYELLSGRLRALGSAFGALPVHHGLWQSAGETAADLKARLAVVHMVHEARGLDVTPQTIERLRRNGDPTSADMLQIIYEEEIGHVTAGMTWFRHVTAAESPGVDPIRLFHEVVRAHFRGPLKPPFNDAARAQAGFTPEWYLPLAA